jgi:hypothetical protein
VRLRQKPRHEGAGMRVAVSRALKAALLHRPVIDDPARDHPEGESMAFAGSSKSRTQLSCLPLHASVFVSISPCATYCLSLCLARRLGHNGNAHFMRVIHRDISRRDISETVSRPSRMVSLTPTSPTRRRSSPIVPAPSGMRRGALVSPPTHGLELLRSPGPDGRTT